MADRSGYIGRAPGDSSVTVARQTFSPTGITTDFTFVSGYTVGYLDLFLNGAKLIEGVDYNATDTSTISLVSAAINGDVLEGVAYKAFNLGDARRIGIQSAGTLVGNVDTLNFVGTGNTFALNGTTIDVSISGGGAGAGGTWSNYDGVLGVTTTKKVKIQNNLEVTGVTTSTGGFVGGSITGTTGSFSGFVAFSTSISVGGTITYEDVTNIDSVGLVTARSGINIVGGGLTVTGISTFNGVSNFHGNITVATGNITLGTYGSNGQVIADQIISGVGAPGTGAQINKGVYNTRVDDDSGVEQNAFNIGNFNDLNSMQIGGRGTITTKSGIVGAGLSVTGIATCNGGVQIGAGQSFGANGPTAVYYGDGSNLTNLPAAGLTTEALVSSGIVTTLNLTTAQDHKVTASGITTITVSGGTEADSHTVRIINSGITTVGFSTFFLFPSGSAPSLPTADGAISLISFTVNRVGAAGTQLLAGASLNFS
jgi:hypothetical protein